MITDVLFFLNKPLQFKILLSRTVRFAGFRSLHGVPFASVRFANVRHWSACETLHIWFE